MPDGPAARFRPGMRVRHIMGDGGGLGLGTVESVTSDSVRVIFDAPLENESEPVVGLYDGRWFRSRRAGLEIVADDA